MPRPSIKHRLRCCFAQSNALLALCVQGTITFMVSVKIEHDDVIKWKRFPRYWPFMRGIHRSSMNSPHKGQWRGALMYSLICTRINCWVNNGEAGDLRRHRAHYDVTVMNRDVCNNNSNRTRHDNWSSLSVILVIDAGGPSLDKSGRIMFKCVQIFIDLQLTCKTHWCVNVANLLIHR